MCGAFCGPLWSQASASRLKHTGSVVSPIFIHGFLKIVYDLLCQHLLRVQNLMKKHAEKNSTFPHFHFGEMVFLKVHPYIQSSIAPRTNHKLIFKFGHFRIIEKIKEVAYRLDLLPPCRGQQCVDVAIGSIPRWYDGLQLLASSR